MFGIPDPVIWIGYLLTLLSVVACVIYSVINWNKSDDVVPAEKEPDSKWEKEENELKELI
jgi:hypothetical protein